MSDFLINASFWFLVLLGIYSLVAVLRDALTRKPKHDPNYYTLSDPRCEQVRLKQEAAREFMKEKGIRTLLEGKPGWRRIVDMSEAPPPSTVVRMRRKP